MNHDRKKEQFDQSQYEFLIRCSEKGDLTQWNKWRENDQTTFNIKEFSSAKIEPCLKESLRINPNPELLSCRNV